MLLESLNIPLTSKNVGGKPYCSSLVCSLASEFTNQNFSKTSTFSCPLISHSVILLIPHISNISSSKHWCMVWSKNICENMYQLCLHSSVIMLFKTYRFSGCPFACIWAPRKSSSKELDPVLYIVGSQWRNVREASVEIHFTCHQLFTRSCPLFCDILLVCIEGGHCIETHRRRTLNLDSISFSGIKLNL